MSTSSSPDPLAMSPTTSPVRPNRRRAAKAPLAQRSSNYNTSPVKSMILEPRDAEGSPWRIKVSVEALDSGKPSSRTATIPLNDMISASSPKRRGRSQVTDAPSSARRSTTKKPTPARQRYSHAAPPTPLPSQHATDDIPELCPVSQLGENVSTDYSLSEIELPENPSHANIPAIADYSLSPDMGSRSRNAVGIVEHRDDEPEAVLGAYAPGDATMLESEEFSMISVDSLTSNRVNGQSSPSQPVNTTEKDILPEPSYMPSSPPQFVADRRTPIPSESTPKNPEAPLATHQHEANVATPLRESARKSGRALQDALNGPFRESTPRELPARESIFGGFSSGTRRQLRQSLQMGQSLSSQPLFGSAVQNAPHLMPSTAAQPNYLSPFQSPVRQPSQSADRPSHLLTPETDGQTQTRSASRSSELHGEVSYPTLSHEEHRSHLISPGRTNDDMSWAARPSSAHTISSTQSQSPQQSVPTRTQSPGNSVGLAQQQSTDEPQFQHEQENEVEDEDRDIWQEEASRSIQNLEDSPQQPDLFLEDLPVKPIRSKLPGTRRRTSGARSNYSDSPEPEEGAKRNISGSTAGTSRKSSGVITPPSSEDGNGVSKETTIIEQKDLESENDDVEGVERVNTPASEVLSQVSEDDTGTFWQANLPAVYRQNKAITSPAKTFAPSSPMRYSFFDISPMRTTQQPSPLQKVTMMDQAKNTSSTSSRTLPSPLRQSLLRSSRMSGGPAPQYRGYVEADPSERTLKFSAKEADQSETQTDSSIASDIRQLQREMNAASSGASAVSSVVHTPSKREDSVLASDVDLSTSYQEELNRDSPMRIKVNFNDDSGNSTLLEPTRQYPPLFDNAPVFAPQPASADASPGSPQQHSPNVVSRLTESFWEAVTRPPVYAPEPKPMIVKETSTSDIPTVPDYVMRLRRKYGLLPEIHPFTYAHIRTLHRMANSTRSRPGASIVPRSGPLSHGLSRLLGKTKTNDLDQRLVWTETLLHIVDAFMSLLLPSSERERLQENGTWGDSEAIRHRGRDSKGRRGDVPVFAGVKGGRIEASWISDVLADIVFKEEMNAKKKKVAEMIARAEKWERMER